MTRPKKTTVCPLGGTGVGGKWMFWIWYHLLSGPKRFGELQRLLPQASRQMLTLQLRELEQLGLIHRQVYTQQPPKVEYSLTVLARSAEPMFLRFHAWGKWFCKQANLDFDDWLISLGGRWTIWIWYLLLDGTRRFGELQRLLPQANRQALATHLRVLEQMGVVHRHVYEQEALKVEYSLTELGIQSGPTLRQTYVWAKWLCDQIGVDYEWPVSMGMEAEAV